MQSVQAVETAQVQSISEPIAADVTAKQTKGKIVITVETNLENAALTVTASKKGAKTIIIPLVTNSDGDKKIIQSRNLTGYTLILKNGSQVLDKVKIK